MKKSILALILCSLLCLFLTNCASRGSDEKKAEEIPPQETKCLLFDGNSVWVQKGDSSFQLDQNGNIISNQLKNVQLLSPRGQKEQIIVFNNGKYGVINSKGSYIIEPLYDQIGFADDNLYFALQNGKYGYIDASGSVVIPFMYDDASDFGDDKLACVSINNKYGFINKNNDTVIEFMYDYATDFNELNLAPVMLDDKLGYIDNKGNVVIPIQFDNGSSSIIPPWVGTLCLKFGDKWGFMYPDGTWAKEPSYSSLFNGSTGCRFQVVYANGKYGYQNILTGELAIDCKFDDARYFDTDNGLAMVCYNGKWGLIKSSGDYYIEPKYDNFFHLCKNYSAVCVNGKYGYISESEQMVISPIFDDASETFYQGLSAVKIDDKWGYIDTNGKIVIPCKFDRAGDFWDDGYAIVEIDERYGVINKKGDFILEPSYTRIYADFNRYDNRIESVS